MSSSSNYHFEHPKPEMIPTSTGTAYPYYPPPPLHQTYPNNNPTSTTTNRHLLRRFLVIFLSLLLIFGLVSLISYLILRPKLPSFTLTSLSSSKNTTTTNFSLSFTVRNPNTKLTIIYSSLVADVELDDYRTSLGFASLPSFSQRKGEITTLKTDVVADRKVVGDSERFDMSVRVMGVISFRSGRWRMRSQHISVFCGVVKLVGSMTGGPRECVVGI